MPWDVPAGIQDVKEVKYSKDQQKCGKNRISQTQEKRYSNERGNYWRQDKQKKDKSDYNPYQITRYYMQD
jgi:hypothetical protein